MGSATSLIEGMALGRNCVGVDISELAVYLAKVKTTVLSQREIQRLVQWAVDTAPNLSPHRMVQRHTDWANAGYQNNMPWQYRKMTEQVINRTKRLPERLEAAARCVVLRTLQWALDCKKHLPSAIDLRKRLVSNTQLIADGLTAFRDQLSSLDRAPTIELFNGSAEIMSKLPSKLLQESPAKLVVTSPPYPGVHVLYHRWQVQSRKETPAPFWIADCSDGEGAAFYTFGDRRRHDHDDQYFVQLQRCFSEVRKVVRDDSVVVQLVGFTRPNKQLPRYLQAMRMAGFEEGALDTAAPPARRKEFWRAVPNRKWYTWLRNETQQTSEILLIHRPS